MNNLCGYKSLEKQAIVNNLVCLTIGEILSKFQQKFHQLLFEFRNKKKNYHAIYVMLLCLICCFVNQDVTEKLRFVEFTTPNSGKEI